MKLSERDKTILQLVHDNPGCSTNFVYVSTSPSCQRRGLEKSFGTWNWSKKRTLQDKGLVKIFEVSRTTERARFVRYHWYITKQGLEALDR